MKGKKKARIKAIKNKRQLSEDIVATQSTSLLSEYNFLIGVALLCALYFIWNVDLAGIEQKEQTIVYGVLLLACAIIFWIPIKRAGIRCTIRIKNNKLVLSSNRPKYNKSLNLDQLKWWREIKGVGYAQGNIISIRTMNGSISINSLEYNNYYRILYYLNSYYKDKMFKEKV